MHFSACKKPMKSITAQHALKADHSLTPRITSCGILIVFIAMFLTALTATKAVVAADAQDNFLTAEETQWVQSHPRIQVGIMADWPPFNTVDEKGYSHGISADIIEEVADQVGLQIELVPGAWKDIYPQLVDKRIDVLMDVTPKPERKPLMNFTDEYLSIPHAIIGRRDESRLHSEADLAGKTVALEKGFGNVKWFQDNHPEVTIKEYPTTRECLEAVARSEVDAYVGNRAVATYILKQEVMHNLSVHGHLRRQPTILAIGVRKDEPLLQSILQKGLERIDGEIKQAILARWTGAPDMSTASQVALSDEERAWLRQHPVLTVGNELDWPPFDFAEEGTPRGLSIDVMNLAAEKVGMQVRYLNGFTWKELMEKLRSGEVDILPAMYYTEDRAQYLEFTKSYASNPSILAFHEDYEEHSSLKQLSGKKVGVVEGYSTQELIEKAFPEITIVPIRNIPDGLYKVSSGEIDATFGSLGVVSYVLENQLISNVRISFDTGLDSDANTLLRIGVLKENAILRDIIQKGLDAITDDEMRTIRHRWIPLADKAERLDQGQMEREIVIQQDEAPLFAVIAVALVVFVLLFIAARMMLRSAKYEAFAMQMGTVRFRLVLTGLLALLVILVSATSWLAFEYNRARILEVVGGNLSTVLDSTVERLDIWIDDEKNSLTALGRDRKMVTLVKTLQTLPVDKDILQYSKALQDVRRYIGTQPTMSDSLGFFIINPDGMSIGSARNENLALPNLIAKTLPDLFKRVLDGESVFVPAMLSDVKLSATQNKNIQQYTMFLAAPLVDEDGTVIAVLTKRINPEGKLSRILHAGNIGLTGESYAFNDNAVMVTTSRFEDELIELGLIKSDESSAMNIQLRPPVGGASMTHMANSALSGQSGVDLDGYLDYRGKTVFGAWIWDSELNLGITTEMDAEEALLPVATLRNTLLFIVGLTLTLSVGTALFTLALGERTSRALRRSKEELEERVDERTRELQEQRDLIKAVMDAMTVGVVAFDKDLRLITWNQNYLDIRGYPQNLVYEGAPFEDLTYYDVERNEFGISDPEQAFIETVETARKFEQHSFERQRPNGKYIEVRGGPISGGGFVSIFADITARKKTERALNVALEENKRQTERFRNLTSNLPAMVFQFMALGPEQIHITYASPFMYDMFEFGDADENELTEIFYKRLHEDDDEHLREALAEVIANNGFLKETFRIRKPNGEVRWLEAAARCYEVTDGFMQWDGLILDITDRMIAEEALRKNEAMLNEMLAASPVGATIVRPDGTLEFFNQRMADMVGMSREQLENIVVRDMYVDPTQRDAITQKLQDGVPVRDEEITLRHKLGHPVYALLTLQEMPSSDGYFGWIYDITERKRFLEALAESEQQNRLILESAGEGIFGLNADGTTAFVNPTACEILGYSLGELVGKKMHDLVHHSYPDGTPYPQKDCHMFAAYHGGDVHHITDEVLWHKDGTAVPVEYTATPIRKDGDLTGAVVTFQDITKRKAAEDALRESQQLLEGVIENSAAVIFFKDKYGVYQLVNRSWEKVTGIKREDAIGKTDFEIFPKEIAEQFWGNDLEVIKSLGLIESEECVQKGEEESTFLSLKFPLVDADGHAEGICGMSTDITDRKRLEAEITDARDKAESATRAKSAFLAAMSHEIRTPMNGVVGMIDLLRETELDTEQAQMMTTVRDSAFALLQIINDILDFSKIEAGKLVLERIPVSLRDVVEGVAETLIPNATSKDVRFVNFIDPAIPHWVLTDQVRVRQILFNLLGNAIKFTETTDDHKGLVKLRADLSGPVKDGRAHITFSIIDNGIGMTPKAVKNLFKPFTQAESSTTRRFGGTGLGLTICKSLSEMLGGEIKVTSVEGEGSTFSVTLPFNIDDTMPAPNDEPSLDGLHMLLVCGEELFFEHIPPYVTGRGGTYDTCRDLFATQSVAEAAAKTGTPFDIIVFGPDLAREQVDTVIEVLRANTAIKGIRFVILTRDRKAKKGMVLPDEMVVSSSPMKRSRFLHALGVASGRCSPDVEDAHEKLTDGVTKAPTPDEAAAQGRLILVVEDNKTNQDVIRRQLTALGYACELSDDGKQGLAAWRSGRYGLVLTDCHMPEMDGYEMTKAIRKAEAKADEDGIAHTPIIAITANALQGEGDRCLATGMDDYLTKPLEMALLKQTLAKWMPAAMPGSTAQNVPTPTNPPQPPIQDATEPPSTMTEATGNDDAPVNPTYLQETFGDDDMVRDILKDYPAPARDIIAEIDEAVAARDAAEVGKAGHKLKSSSRAIGADALADLCFELEKAGKGGNFTQIEELYEQLHPTFDAVLSYIESL